jgi:hypothetical protein
MLFETGQSGQETTLNNVLALKPIHFYQAVTQKFRGQNSIFTDDAGTTPANLNDEIGALRNFGSNGGLLAQSNSSRRPIWNGIGVIFDGIDDLMTRSVDPTISPPYTVVIWATPNSPANSGRLIANEQDLNGIWVRETAGDAIRFNFGTQQDLEDLGTGIYQKQVRVILRNVNSSSSYFDVREAGVLLKSDTGGVGSSGFSTINIGNRTNLARALDGGIQGVAIYDRALTDEELASLPERLVLPTNEVEQVLLMNPDTFVQMKYVQWRGEQILFQDTAGTTPVTTTSQSIGLVKNLGTLGGDMIADNDASRPVWDGIGGNSTGNAAMDLNVPSLSQPMTHVLWIDNFDKLTGENRYPVDSKNGSTVRHQPFGRVGITGSGTSDGDIIAATPDPAVAVNNSNSFSGRMLLVSNGSSSSLQLNGTINLAPTTLNPGTDAQDGVTLFSNRGRTQKVPGRIIGYARFPRVLTAEEIALLPTKLEAEPTPLQKILNLDPIACFSFNQRTYAGQQILFQDAALTTPVTAEDDPIGGVVNLGTEGGKLESSGTLRPLWKSGADFDGSNDMLEIQTGLTLDQPYTVVVYTLLTRTAGAESFARLYNGYPATGAGGFSNAVSAGNATYFMQGDTASLASGSPYPLAKRRHIVAHNGNSSRAEIRNPSGTVNVARDAVTGSSGNSTGITVGNRSDGLRAYNGTIQLIAVYPRLLTNDEKNSLPTEL